MPRMYVSTKKGKLEMVLRHPSTPPLTPKEMQAEMAALGVNVSMASIRSAIEEWEMNGFVAQDEGAYRWRRRTHGR